MALNKIQYLKQTARRSAIVVLLPAMASAQSDFWEQTNGPPGADALAISLDSTARIVVGTNAGVYAKSESEDPWILLGLSEHSVYSIAVHSTGIILAGASSGLFRSENQGQTWNLSDLEAQASRIETSTTGSLFALVDDGIYRSVDVGNHWTRIRDGGYWDLAINPAGDVLATDFINLIRSTDDGNSWEVLPLITTYGNPTTLFALYDDEIYLGTVDPGCPWPGPHPCVPYSGLFRSTNEGASWTVVSANSEIIGIEGTSSGDLFLVHEAARGLSRYRPSDSSFASTGLTGVNAVAQGLDGSLYAGGDGWGVFVSSDDGVSWQGANEGLILSTVPVMVSVDSGYLLAGASSNIWRTSDRGDAWEDALGAFYGLEPLCVEMRESSGPLRPTSVFLGISVLGIYESEDLGTTWTFKGFPSVGGGDWWYGNVYALLNGGNNRLFAGARLWDDYGSTDDGLFLSTDDGESWEKIGLDGISIRSLSVDSAGTIYAGSAGDGVYRSTDDGTTWSLSGLAIGYVTAIQGTRAGNVLAGTDGNGVFRSTNAGLDWTPVTQGLSTNRISSIEMSGEGELYAGSYDQGVFVSVDDGESWNQVVLGLTNMSVKSLSIDAEGYVYAGTDGSGVFRSVSPTTLVDGREEFRPSNFGLYQNYPNPFNPSTTISFSIPQSAIVNLKVYDLLGREVAVVVSERLSPGTHRWEWDATGLSSGVYFYRLRADSNVETRKLVLVQ